MSTKDFKTIDEQLEILRSRGLIIDDENIAKDFLLYNNYYRISGYSLHFVKITYFQNLQVSKISLTFTILIMNSGTLSFNTWK